jgi:hypothetical protein
VGILFLRFQKRKLNNLKEGATKYLVAPNQNLGEKMTIFKEKFGGATLKMIYNDGKKNRRYCKFHGKIFFPMDHTAKAGWHVVSILEEKENFGIVDVIPVDQITLKEWQSSKIKGSFLHANYQKGVIEVMSAEDKYLSSDLVQPIIIEIKMPNVNLMKVSKDSMVKNILGD